MPQIETTAPSRGAPAQARRRHTACAVLATALALLVAGSAAQADVIRINTGNDGKPGVARGQVDPGVTWNYTGDFLDPRFASYVDSDPVFPGTTTIGSCHMLGGNCRLNNNSNYGPDVPGAYPAYRGVQFFYLTFDLPSDAFDVSLTVTEVGADDRVGLHLNDIAIDFWGNHSGGPLTGRIDGSDIYAGTSIGPGAQPGLNPVTLQSPFGFPDFVLDDPSLFVLGGTNVIRLWVNNTNSRSPTAAARPMGFNDPSLVGFDALLSFSTAQVPEPPALLLLAIALVLLRAGRLGGGALRRRG